MLRFSPRQPLPVPYLPILAFSLLYAGATFAWQVPYLVGGAYLLASVACFAAYALDKAAARAGQRRTPESTLLALGLAGGWPGALLARHWLRHKSGKAAFRAPFWATVIVNVAAFVYLSSPGSFLRGL